MSSHEQEELSDSDKMDRVSHAIINYEYDTINKYSYAQLLISTVKAKQIKLALKYSRHYQCHV